MKCYLLCVHWVSLFCFRGTGICVGSHYWRQVLNPEGQKGFWLLWWGRNVWHAVVYVIQQWKSRNDWLYSHAWWKTIKQICILQPRNCLLRICTETQLDNRYKLKTAHQPGHSGIEHLSSWVSDLAATVTISSLSCADSIVSSCI